LHFPKSPSNYRATPGGLDAAQVGDGLQLLLSAQWPLFFIGTGARTALADHERRERFLGLVDKFAIPVMTTPGAKGTFPEDHPLSLRNYGMAACEWPQYYMQPAKI